MKDLRLSFLAVLTAFFLAMILPEGALALTISGDNVGVGTNSPAYTLDVVGNINASGNLSAGGSISGGSASLSGSLSADSATITGALSAGSFSGSGAGVSNVNAATLNGQTSSQIIAAAVDERRTSISSLPFTISSSGSYYLTQNLSTSGDGITVSADNVTIDFNGFTITGPGKASGTGYGVILTGRKNVEVRNGTVKEFGYTGIYDNAGMAHRILNMRVMDNGGSGVWMQSEYHLASNCSLKSNGGYGIQLGAGATVTGNNVIGSGSNGIGVGEGSTVSGNTAYYNAYGIAAGSGSTVSGNAVAYSTTHGIGTDPGVTIIGNSSYFNGRNGIDAGQGSSIKNNSMYYNNWNGLYLAGDNLVDGNTAYGNNRAGGYYNITSCATCTFGDNVAP